RDVAEGLLRHVEHRQERAPRVGIERLQPTDFGELRLGEDYRSGVRETGSCRGCPVRGARGAVALALAHRSSSPPIMLTEPNVGIRSATISPTIIRWSAASGGRHGGRHRTRYGRSEPSETTENPSSPFAPPTGKSASPTGGRMPQPSMTSMQSFIRPFIGPYTLCLECQQPPSPRTAHRTGA